MYFADKGCIRTWCNLYRYATGADPNSCLVLRPVPYIHVTPTVSTGAVTQCSLNWRPFWFINFALTFWFSQKEPKWLLPDTFSYLKIHQNAFAAVAGLWIMYSSFHSFTVRPILLYLYLMFIYVWVAFDNLSLKNMMTMMTGEAHSALQTC